MKNRRIGLVTWLGSGNFGTTLQAFALNEKLKSLGFDVLFFTPYSNKTFVKRILGFFGYPVLRNKAFYRKMCPNNGDKLYDFIHKNFKVISPSFKFRFVGLINSTDVFISGSDQIWNVRHKFDPFMFLEFASEKKKVAYASSIGISSVPEEYRNDMKHLLLKFAHIGVREKVAVDILSDLTGRNDIVQVLDPTFLLRPDDWKNVADNIYYEFELPKKYILCYLIGNNDDYVRQIKNVREKTNIQDIVIIPSAETPNLNVDGAILYPYAGPREFVDLISRAAFVCTDSFHATALSINMSKDFVEFVRFKDSDGNSQNSRIYDVLNHYHLGNRIYKAGGEDWYGYIDYVKVQEILEADRIFSENYLITSIEG